MSAVNKPEAGWYPDETWPGWDRYWTGEKWTDQRREARSELSVTESAAGLFVLGLMIAAIFGGIGASMFTSESTDRLGMLVLIVGGSIGVLLIQIATIAWGVALGVRMARGRA